MPILSSWNVFVACLALAHAAVAAPAAPTPARATDAVAQAAREALAAEAERIGLVDPEVQVEVLPAGNAAVAPEPPACAQPWSVEALDARHATRMRFAATCAAATRTRVEFIVRGTVTASVVVTSTEIPSGRVIGAAEVSLERRDVSAVPDPVADLSAIAGMSSRRALHPGQVVQRQWLVAPVIVKRGDAVRIVARTGPVAVDVPGEAMEPGRRDDVVRVRNTTTGRVIRARVIDASTVEPADTGMTQSPP
jgi:flagella basal body P-ring formation protein FlgA